MATETKQPTGNGTTTDWPNTPSYVDIDDGCTQETTGCLDGSNPCHNIEAIGGSFSSGKTEMQITFDDTTYTANGVSQVAIHAFCSAHDNCSAIVDSDHTVSIDTDLFNDEKTLAAGGTAAGWQSAVWTGSWTSAQINGMVTSFFLTASGWGQTAIAAAYIVYTEASGGSPTRRIITIGKLLPIFWIGSALEKNKLLNRRSVFNPLKWLK